MVAVQVAPDSFAFGGTHTVSESPGLLACKQKRVIPLGKGKDARRLVLNHILTSC